jgi:hypothetical protein
MNSRIAICPVDDWKSRPCASTGHGSATALTKTVGLSSRIVTAEIVHREAYACIQFFYFHS